MLYPTPMAFNFKLPDESQYRYTKDHPYIGKGLNREVKEGVEYIGFEADVAEFNDLYMGRVYSDNGVQKMGLGIDEVVTSTINFSRKNYADYFPENPYPKDVKLVGNTIKSKKMPVYIERFLSIAVRLLLQGKGQEFLEEYYKYIEKIYNYQIPIREIATKGKVKKSIDQYKKDVKEITKAGRPKSRQAWYELAIKHDLKIDNGDTIYYINTGKSKSHSDVKKIAHIFNNGVEITKDVEKEYKIYKKECTENGVKKPMTKQFWLKSTYPNHYVEDEIVLNCELVPQEIIDAEKDIYCDGFVLNGANVEYNCPKYLDMFNKRIKPLLVCFSKDIRSDIMITNPDDRKFFTSEQCRLVSGEPNKLADQDTYEQLMTMEDKEISFWTRYGMVPPFVEECKMGTWDEIVADYERRMKEEYENGVAEEKAKFAELIEEITEEEFNNLCDEGELPESILAIVDIDPITMQLVSRKREGAVIGSVSDIIDQYKLRMMLNN